MTDAARHELEDAAVRVSEELYALTDQLEKLRKRSRLWIGGVVVVLIPLVVTVAVGAYFFQSMSQRADCQAKINRELRTVAVQERKEYNETWQKILDAKSPAEARAIFAKHLADRKATEAQRDAIEVKERDGDRC